MTHSLSLFAGASLFIGLIGLPAQPLPSAAPDPLQELPATLDEQLAMAILHSPKVQVAEAKLRTAQAELREVQLLVTEQVIAAHNELIAQEKNLASARRLAEQTQKLHEQSFVSAEEIVASQLSVDQAEALSTQVEARLRHLIGVIEGAPADLIGSTVRNTEKSAAQRRPGFTSEQADYLDGEIENVVFENANLEAVLEYVARKLPVSMQIHREPLEDEVGPLDEVLVNAKFARTDVQGLLTCLTDLVPSLTFVMRDYGVLATSEFDAGRFFSPSIPNVPLDPGVVRPLGKR